MSEIICPICKEELEEQEKRFVCANGHSFDKAKQGYVNLLMSQKSSEKRHGDDKLMVKARSEFLDGGYYLPLLKELCTTVDKFANRNSVIIDCGCGEGYYTNGICKFLDNKQVKMYGTDISKDAVAFSSSNYKDISFSVSSVSALPYKTGCADIIISIFAPYNDKEFYRVLNKNGVLIRIIPLENHLLSLKKAVYDNPYKNIPDMPMLFGFSLKEQKDIKYNFTVKGTKISDLFKMTPYYYKTSVTDQKKLDNIDALTTEAEFRILIYCMD